MKEVILAFLSGGVVGFLFYLIRLPLPAPPVLAGVMGVFGVYFGGVVAERVLQYFQ